MEPQTYKFITTHYHEVSWWNILSRILHERETHLGVINGDVQYDLDTLAFKQVEKLEKYHVRIIMLQQEFNPQIKMYIQQGLYSSTRNLSQIVMNSRILLHQR